MCRMWARPSVRHLTCWYVLHVLVMKKRPNGKIAYWHISLTMRHSSHRELRTDCLLIEKWALLFLVYCTCQQSLAWHILNEVDRLTTVGLMNWSWLNRCKPLASINSKCRLFPTLVQHPGREQCHHHRKNRPRANCDDSPDWHEKR